LSILEFDKSTILSNNLYKLVTPTDKGHLPMPQSVEALVEQFRREGRKITPQRRAIFEVLIRDHRHPTAEEIYQRVHSVMPDISRTTVYNTLHELVAVGALMQVADLSEGGTRYDTRTSPHDHLLCLGCQTLVDIDRHFPQLDLPPDETAGYRIVRRQVTFYGYCPNCQEKESG
jgi:Fe2+ or Zn2+ uptake regulation protein